MQCLCIYQRAGQPASKPGVSQASGQSKQSASKTFITEMLQFNVGQEKVDNLNIFIVKTINVSSQYSFFYIDDTSNIDLKIANRTLTFCNHIHLF